MTASLTEQEPAIASAGVSPAAHPVTSAGPDGDDTQITTADRSGRRRARAAVPRSKRLDLRVSEEELMELRRLAGLRGISIQRMLVDDALDQRRTNARLVGARDAGDVDVDGLVGELMRLRGDLGRAGNMANQAVREARRLDSDAGKFAKLNDAVEAVREIARAAAQVRETAMKLGRLR